MFERKWCQGQALELKIEENTTVNRFQRDNFLSPDSSVMRQRWKVVRPTQEKHVWWIIKPMVLFPDINTLCLSKFCSI